MTLEEAIHNLQLHLDGNLQLYNIKLRHSMHLSIEALKAWRRLKQGHQFTRFSLLPGETRE